MNCNDCDKPIDVQPEDKGGVVVCLDCMVEREKDLVVGRISFEMPTINGIPGRPVKVIKRDQTSGEQLRRHAIGMLKELVAMYPTEAADIVRSFRLQKTQDVV